MRGRFDNHSIGGMLVKRQVQHEALASRFNRWERFLV